MVRIVGGIAGGRRLAVPRSPRAGTRPTSERVREAMFSALDSLVGTWDGLRVLDLYAGSGALGLEALSRGAESVLLVENDRAAVRVLRENAESLGLAGWRIEAADVAALSRQEIPAEAPFDLVLVDPPYAVPLADVSEVLTSLTVRGWFVEGAVGVVERPSRERPPARAGTANQSAKQGGSADPTAMSADQPWPAGWTGLRRRDYGDTCLWYGRLA